MKDVGRVTMLSGVPHFNRIFASGHISGLVVVPRIM